MATRQNTTRVRKKETVVPFKDELNFVVPKKGGFGQPDNEHYVMVAGSSTIGNTPSPTDTTQTGTGIGTTTLDTTTSTHITPPTPTTTTPTSDTPTLPPLANLPTTSTTIATPDTQATPPPTINDIPCTSFTYGSWSACVNGKQTRTYVGIPSGCIDVPPPNQTEQTCTSNPNATDTLIDTIPTFPNWDTLDCTALDAQINLLAQTLATGSFTQRVVDAYNTQLALARNLRNTKCPIKDTTTAVIVPTPTDITSGGGGFGGGGGGLGESPSDESATTTEETTTSTNNKKLLLVILAIVGGMYLLTRNK